MAETNETATTPSSSSTTASSSSTPPVSASPDQPEEEVAVEGTFVPHGWDHEKVWLKTQKKKKKSNLG